MSGSSRSATPKRSEPAASASGGRAEPPRYIQILDELRRRVEEGRYPVESSLPTESELCEEFGASRYTVREALRRLVDQGMVSRRQGAGSVVTAARPQARYVQSLSSLADLFQFALDTHYEVLSTGVVAIDETIAEGIGGQPGERWILIAGIRRTAPGGEVVCYTHSYVPRRLHKHVRGLPGVVGPFYAHLAERSGEEIVEADQEIRGEIMSEDIARHLEREPGAVALCVLRRYLSREGTLIASYNWHVAETFISKSRILRNA
jgi:DNA-binding GntR family transcriptional regulator